MKGYRIAKGVRNLVRVICIVGILAALACAALRPSRATCELMLEAASDELATHGKTEDYASTVDRFKAAGCSYYADIALEDESAAAVPDAD